MKTLSLIMATSAVLFCCQQKEIDSQDAVETKSVANASTAFSIYGDTIQAEGSVKVDALPKLLENAQDDSVQIKLSATAINSCKMKGCFMNVSLPDSQQMRVSFRDYSFFVPKDLAGEQVIIEGVAFKSLTGVETLKHMAEDAGAKQSDIDTIQHPRVEYRFIADGVLIAEN